MQNFVISSVFVLVVAATRVNAGTRTANPGELTRASNLWEKHCANGREGGREGSIFIHCKHPLQSENQILTAAITGTDNGRQQRVQYIFVQPPPLQFTHEVDVAGNKAFEPKTIVYVQPAKSTHRYTADLDVKGGQHVKPELVFLSGNQGSVAVSATGAAPTRTTNDVNHIVL